MRSFHRQNLTRRAGRGGPFREESMPRFRRTTVRVHGLRELQRSLQQLPKAVRGGVLEEVLIEAAKSFRDQAEQLAPARTGRLKESITVAVEKSTSTYAEVAIGPRENTIHGFFQEFGTAHHGAQPFMRPAWDSNKRTALRAIARELRERITKAAERLARHAKNGA